MNPAHGEWWDFSWNPVTGCTHGCPECWARNRMAPRQKDFAFLPTFHPTRLEQPTRRKAPAIIFTVDMGDLFCEGMSLDWQEKVMDVVERNHRHAFIILTKNPAGAQMYFYKHGIPENLVLGTSITGDPMWDRNGPDPVALLPPLSWGGMRMLSVEPLLREVHPHLPSWENLSWVVVGALTLGGGATVQPDTLWVTLNIRQWCYKHHIPVWEKKNLEMAEHYRQMPKRLVGIRGWRYASTPH